MCVLYIKASADSPQPLEDTGKTVALMWNDFRSLGEHMGSFNNSHSFRKVSAFYMSGSGQHSVLLH